jgi:hypothetical protein
MPFQVNTYPGVSLLLVCIHQFVFGSYDHSLSVEGAALVHHLADLSLTFCVFLHVPVKPGKDNIKREPIEDQNS